MTKASDNAYPSILVNETTVPSAPAASKRRLWVDANHILRWIDSASLDSPLVALNKWDGTVAPTVNEDSGDGYAVGSRWIDTTANKEYVCLDASVGAAVWTETTQAGGGAVATDAIWDAKGDLAGGTGANTAARLPIGTDNTQVLVPKASEATGLLWRGSAGVRLYHSTTQTVTAGATTALTFDSEETDSDGFHSAGAPTKIIIPTGFGGLYAFEFAGFANYGDLASFLRLTKGGATQVRGTQTYATRTTAAEMIHRAGSLVAVAGDEYEVYFHNDHTISVDIGHASADEVRTVFGMFLIR